MGRPIWIVVQIYVISCPGRAESLNGVSSGIATVLAQRAQTWSGAFRPPAKRPDTQLEDAADENARQSGRALKTEPLDRRIIHDGADPSLDQGAYWPGKPTAEHLEQRCPHTMVSIRVMKMCLLVFDVEPFEPVVLSRNVADAHTVANLPPEVEQPQPLLFAHHSPAEPLVPADGFIDERG